jgi:hypothetical protein
MRKCAHCYFCRLNAIFAVQMLFFCSTNDIFWCAVQIFSVQEKISFEHKVQTFASFWLKSLVVLFRKKF